MRSHPDFGQVLQWTPEDLRASRARQLRVRGAAAGAVGAALLAWGLSPWLGSKGASVLPLPTVLGALLASFAGLTFKRALALAAGLPKGALLRRPALVTERRSEMSGEGASFRTDYFFTLEFEDGSVGEFLFPGRGTSHDLLVPGNTGLAFTRATLLLDFIKVRV